jgi:hypothetical protein
VLTVQTLQNCPVRLKVVDLPLFSVDCLAFNRMCLDYVL